MDVEPLRKALKIFIWVSTIGLFVFGLFVGWIFWG